MNRSVQNVTAVMLFCAFFLTACTRTQPTPAGRLMGFVDSPRTGQTASGSVPIVGWAAADDGVASVCLLVDKKQQICTKDISGFRPDVQETHQDVKGSKNSGWNISFDTREVSNGTHELAVQMTSNTGQTGALGTLTINVAN